MRAVIALQLSVWHFRAAGWHHRRGEAWHWKSYAYTDPKNPWRWTGAEKMCVASLSVGLFIALLGLWFGWRVW